MHRPLEFCNLEPEEFSFQFHKTERAVHTPSAEQVRQPIHPASLDHWGHFEKGLEPLQEAFRRFEVLPPEPSSRPLPAAGEHPSPRGARRP